MFVFNQRSACLFAPFSILRGARVRFYTFQRLHRGKGAFFTPSSVLRWVRVHLSHLPVSSGELGCVFHTFQHPQRGKGAFFGNRLQYGTVKRYVP